MKKSWKTRVTALMFSAAAIGTGAVSVSCGVYGPPNVPSIDIPADSDGLLSGSEEVPTLYGPPSVQESSGTSEAAADLAVPIDLDSMTDDDFRNMSNDMLAAIGKQYAWLPKPAFCGDLPAGFPDRCAVTKKATDSQEEAFRLACEEFTLMPEGLYHEESGRYWLYTGGSGVTYYFIVPDRAFYDPEAQTLNADVTEENMLLLAAMRVIPGERILGAFVKDEGDKLTCKEYYLLYSGGDYGLSDTATMYGFSFSADKETGKLTDYQSDLYGFSREVEIPGTYHPYPDESAEGAV